MILALLGGSLLALGHHLFYANLDHKAVQTGSYHFAGKKLSKQQVNTAVGTAFAFLVKVFLGFAVSAAYIQIFWRSTKNAKEYPTLTDLDWAKAALANIFSLFNLKIWWRYPLLLLLAAIFWCVPVATIFPPATLSVESAPGPPWSMLQVPQLDFTSLNYAAGLRYDLATLNDDGLSNWAWTGPSQPVQHIALAVMGLGQILPITSPTSNASWTLDFWGPALQCNDVEPAQRDKIWTNIWNSYNSLTNIGPYSFLSWVPRSYTGGWGRYTGGPPRLTGSYFAYPDLPLHCDGAHTTCASPPGPEANFVSIGQHASLFVAVLPATRNLTVEKDFDSSETDISFIGSGSVGIDCPFQMVHNISDSIIHGCFYSNSTPGDSRRTTFKPSIVYEDSTLLRCDLVNTSYSVDFGYSSGTQDIRITSNMTGNSPVVNAEGWFIGPSPSASINDTNLASCITFQANQNGAHNGRPCVFDVEAVRSLSYQGVMAAFNQLVLGTIQNIFQWSSVSTNTTVMKTVLAQTDELAFIRGWNPKDSTTGTADFQTEISSTAGWDSLGLVNTKLPHSRGDLRSTLEELFQNYTISLLAEPYLQPNYSSPFAPPQHVNVSLETYHNVYHYDQVTLWIAYGLAILFTLLAAVAGMAALIINGASYSDNFSTIVRISRTAELSVEVMDYDGSGHDPLPTYLKHARIDLGANAENTKAVETAETPSEQQSLVSTPQNPPARSRITSTT